MAITGKIRTRGLASRYPVTSGITAETTKTEGRIINLVPSEGSNIPIKDRKNL